MNGDGRGICVLVLSKAVRRE